MSVCIHDTILAIADQLGITIKHSALDSYSQEAEFRFEQIISPISILNKKAHCSRLTVDQVNMVLESRRMPKLYGYSQISDIKTQKIKSDDCDLIVAIDKEVDLNEEANKEPEREFQNKQFGFQWAIIDGIQITQRSFLFDEVRPPLMKEILFKKNFHVARQIQNKNILSSDMIDYYSQVVELFDDQNDEESIMILLDNVESDGGIQDLLPGFLQFLNSKLTTGLSDLVTLRKIKIFCFALIENQSLPILLYAHAFLRILMTIILKNTLSGNCIDDDLDVRKDCSVLLGKLCLRCSSGYRDIKISISNGLVNGIFNTYSSLISQLGALNGLYIFDKQVLLKNITNIRSYALLIKRELFIEKQRQKDFACKILDFLQHLFKEVIEDNLMKKDQVLKIERIQKEITTTLNKFK